MIMIIIQYFRSVLDVSQCNNCVAYIFGSSCLLESATLKSWMSNSDPGTILSSNTLIGIQKGNSIGFGMNLKCVGLCSTDRQYSMCHVLPFPILLGLTPE